MPEMFNWRTDEEAWETPEAGAPTAVATRKMRRLLPLLLIALLAIAGALLVRQLDERITTTSSAVTADVIAAHNLLAETVLAQDSDLFAALLSEADSFWYDTQLEMLDLSLVMDRAPLGLWASKGGYPADVQVSLSPDLTQAEVTDQYTYYIEPSTGVTATIDLLRTAVYTRDEDRWLLAPLPDDRDFWGPWITEEGEYLALIFAERDAELGHRLAPDLDNLAQQLCAEPAVSCRPGFRFQLRLARDTPVLLHLRENYERLNVGFNAPLKVHLDLPSPTLVGMPVDEAGYDALLRGYSGWVAALMSYRLQSEQPRIFPQAPPWLDELGIALPPPAGYRPRPISTEKPPLPLPPQQVQFLCEPYDTSSGYLRLYDPHNDRWMQPPLIGDTGIFSIEQMLPGEADEGIVLTVHDARLRHRTIIWQSSRRETLLETSRSHSVLSWLQPEISFDGRYMPFYEEAAEGDPNGQLLMLDRENCTEAGCSALAVAGVPYWSPDGHFTLIMDNSEWPADLSLGDAVGNKLADVDSGWAPIWLENNRVGYVRPLADSPRDWPRVELVAAEVFTSPSHVGEPVTLLSAAELQQILKDSPNVAHRLVDPNMLITGLYRHPVEADLLLVSAVGFGEFGAGHQFYFLYDWQSDETSLLFSLKSAAGSPPLWTDNGRFLTVLTVNSTTLTLFVHDTEAGETLSYPIYGTSQYPLPTYDWSLNQEWLVIAEDRALRFIAPAYGYEYAVYHNYSGCDTAVWVNR